MSSVAVYPEAKNFSLLVIDDEELALGILQKIFNGKVKNVFVATDGEEGLRIFEKERPDIVLSDIKMPKVDGITLTKSIREIDSEARIILMSAFGDAEYISSAIRAGVKGFCIKPFNANYLKRLLNDQVAGLLYARD